MPNIFFFRVLHNYASHCFKSEKVIPKMFPRGFVEELFPTEKQ